MKGDRPPQKQTISRSFFRWLLIIVLVGFALSMIFSWTMQTKMSQNNAASLLRINIGDVRQDIIDASDKNLLELTAQITAVLDEQGDEADSATLLRLMEEYDVAEINLVNAEGIITVSTNPAFVGFNFASGAQAAEFLTLLDGSTRTYVQGYQPITYESSISRKYAGEVLAAGGFVQVGYDAARFQRDVDRQVIGITHNWHVGEGGCILVADANWSIVSDRSFNEGKNLSETGIRIDPDTMAEGVPFRATVYGEDSYCMYVVTEGYYVVAVIPQNEIVLQRDTSVRLTAFLEVLVFLVLFVMIFLLVKRLVVNNIDRVNNSLTKITGGDLNEVVDVRSNVEFASLSDDINSTVKTLKNYIAEAAARIDQELEIARAIQVSVLPRVFPAFPDRTEFDIYASMDPAKEVGGDFYDFFLVDEDHLALVMADVSGKGIPAAMFMMTAKTLIKNRTMAGGTPAQILSYVNEQLCEGNDAELFVTVWLAVLELSTGRGMAANAGHEHPVICRANGRYELVEYRHSPAVATMEGIRFREHAFQLHPGDRLFVYTDGVPEATDPHDELFGSGRMLEALNGDPEAEPEQLLRNVRAAINAFVGDAPQFDDITMLGFRYFGSGKQVPELTVEARDENLAQVLAFVDGALEGLDCPPRTQMQIDVAVEEIFVNIAHYAYAPEVGSTTVQVETASEPRRVTITFMDRGVPYDPLAKPDPDVTLSAEERQIGGLGIYMVKMSMDDMRYEYRDGQNVLTIEKAF